LNVSGLDGVVSHTMEVFMNTGVSTSNATKSNDFLSMIHASPSYDNELSKYFRQSLTANCEKIAMMPIRVGIRRNVLNNTSQRVAKLKRFQE
jgi:hypothetical protein